MEKKTSAVFWWLVFMSENRRGQLGLGEGTVLYKMAQNHNLKYESQGY